MTENTEQDTEQTIQLTSLEAEIDPANPWSDDAWRDAQDDAQGDNPLSRKTIADKLTKVIDGQESPFVLSLSGDWGTGKTFILKRWRQELENDGYKSIYFNAWEDDFCDDSLVAIIGQLSEKLEDTNESTIGKIKEVTAKLLHKTILMVGAEKSEKLENTNKSMMDKITKIIVKMLPKKIAIAVAEKITGGVIDAKLIDELVTDKTVSEYNRQVEARDELRDYLKSLACEVKSETNQPLVFIIDELDRCRPTFAIELLERVKHIFNVPNMVFIIGINRDELIKSICSVYGEIDANTYLHRFFDLNLIMPEAPVVNFVASLYEKYNIKQYMEGNSAGLQDNYELFCSIIHTAKLSLRDIDHCMKHIVFVYKMGYKKQYPSNISAYIVLFLFIMKIKNNTLYKNYLKGESTGKEIMDWIDKYIDGHTREEESIIIVETCLYIKDCKRIDDAHIILENIIDKLKNHRADSERYLSDETRNNRERMLKMFQYIAMDRAFKTYGGEIIKNILSSIDLFESPNE